MMRDKLSFIGGAKQIAKSKSMEVFIMIRPANWNDLEAIENSYNEHFQYELEHGAFTVFKKNVYPTRKDAEKAIQNNSLYVFTKEKELYGSIIIDDIQPSEYENICWKMQCDDKEIMVIHLLMVRPSMSGNGVASSLIEYAVELAKQNSCKVLRLDTGSQNIPAVSLYRKMGFEIAAAASKKVGDVIAHDNHLFLEKIVRKHLA